MVIGNERMENDGMHLLIGPWLVVFSQPILFHHAWQLCQVRRRELERERERVREGSLPCGSALAVFRLYPFACIPSSSSTSSTSVQEAKAGEHSESFPEQLQSPATCFQSCRQHKEEGLHWLHLVGGVGGEEGRGRGGVVVGGGGGRWVVLRERGSDQGGGGRGGLRKETERESEDWRLAPGVVRTSGPCSFKI